MHVFDSEPLQRLLTGLRFTCLDVGARRGFTTDLLPIASAVDAVGFEPDREEADRLNGEAARARHPWRSLRFLPVALGPAGAKVLHLYRQRGCSSILEADVAAAARFSRDDYFVLDGDVDLTTVPADEALRQHQVTHPVYMKIDVQGYELEVFRTAGGMLADSLLAIRCEVSFIPLYKDQPLFGDIAGFLRPFGFVPMGFQELHHWRPSTRVKYHDAPGPIPAARGQLVHGDVLFLRDAHTMPDQGDAATGALLKLAFLALTYGYVDHAVPILRRPALAPWLRDHGVPDAVAALAPASRWWGRLDRRNRRSRWLLDMRRTLKFRLGI